MNNKIQQFAKVAEKYCQWAESLKPEDKVNLDDLFLLLSDLLNKILIMPYKEATDSSEEIKRFSQEEWKEIHKGFTPLPFQYYRELFDPHDFEEDEPATGDLHDDLSDIYCDLKPAIVLYDRGLVDDATFEWKSTFRYHWGEHLLSAMRTIYIFER